VIVYLVTVSVAATVILGSEAPLLPDQSTESALAVLTIINIKSIRFSQSLIVEGDVANTGHSAHEIPNLRIALQDAADVEIQSKIISSGEDNLQPGEMIHFKTSFDHWSETAKQVNVAFASTLGAPAVRPDSWIHIAHKIRSNEGRRTAQ
jgi:hypothetical protein